MNRTPDVELVLRDYFADDGGAAPDYVLDGVELRIRRQPQRRSWRLRGRLFMNTYAKLAAAAAAILVVGFVGWQLLPGGNTNGGQPTPAITSNPTVAPTAAPSITAPPSRPPLSQDNHPFADKFTWQLTLPAGWSNSNWYVFPAELRPEGNDPENPNGLAVAVFDAPEVLMDPCASDPDLSETSTVAELVAAIQGQDEWVVSSPVDATVAGYSGQRLDVQLPADLSRCGENFYVVFLNPGATPDGVYAQGPGWQLRLWVLDVDGRLVVLARESFAATPANRLGEADTIIASSVFTP